MKKFLLNHWYIKENELLISLTRFFAKIKILNNNETIYFKLFINDGENKEVVLNFYTIEDVVFFTEQIVNKCININEIYEKYNLMFESKNFINLNRKLIN